MHGTTTGNGGCPVAHGATTLAMRSNRDWWPNQLNLRMLHQNTAPSSPMSPAFNYAAAFGGLDYQALKQDLFALMLVDALGSIAETLPT